MAFSPFGTVPTSMVGSTAAALGLPSAKRTAATKKAAQSARMTVFICRCIRPAPSSRVDESFRNATLPARKRETLPVTSAQLDIYCLAIGGTGMAPLACLLQEQGHRVRGTDGPLYPPMSTLLERSGIRSTVGYDPAHLTPRPGLVVVGNAVHRNNPEAVAAEAAGLPLVSM